MKVYDVSLPIRPDLAGWPGDAPFEWRWTLRQADGASINLGEMSASVHLGTHADAPYHFDSARPTIDQIDPDVYVGPAQVIDVSACETIRLEHLIGLHRHTPRLLLRTSAWRDYTIFPDSIPVLDTDVPEWLAAAGVRLLGVDVPSVDALDSKDLPIHHALNRHGIAILESLYLAETPPGLYELIALPLRIAGADGSPVRAILRTMD